jgi:hypothetical protein
LLFDGLLCVSGDLRFFRGLWQEDGVATDGGFVAQEPTGTYFVVGGRYTFQYWSRDVSAPSACGTGANTSPAITVTLTP